MVLKSRLPSMFPTDDLLGRDADSGSDSEEDEVTPETCEPEESSVESLNRQYRKWLTFRRISDVVLVITELVGLVCVAWPAGLQLQAGGGLSDASDTRYLQTVRDNLVYYDEVLTVSARLCALSGRSEFGEVYNGAVPPLEENLNEILRLRPDQADKFVSTTSQANTELIRLEAEGLRGCEQGPNNLSTAEAAPFVMGLEYDLWKGDFTYGIQFLQTDIDNYVLQQRAASWEQTVYLWTVGIVVMLLLGLAQAALHVQEEQSDTLAAEFDDHVDRLQARTSNAAQSTEAWGNDMEALKPAIKAHDRDGPVHSIRQLRETLSQRHTKNMKGFWNPIARALSPRGMILPAKKRMSTTRMAADALLLRRYMPRVVFMLHVVALGCLLTPPFIQLQTDSLVRMGHVLGEISELVDDIRYYDEVLTGSARLCAMTGEQQWMVRYLQNVGHIDVAIENVVSRQAAVEDKYPQLQKQFGGNLGEYFLDTTDAANRQLIELEGVVISNCTNAFLNHRLDLFSAEYMGNKTVLLQGLEKLSTDFVDSVQAQENDNIALVNQRYTIVVIALIGIRGIVGLMFAYYYSKLNWLDDKVKVGSIRKAIKDGRKEEDRQKAIDDRTAAEEAGADAAAAHPSGRGSRDTRAWQ